MHHAHRALAAALTAALMSAAPHALAKDPGAPDDSYAEARALTKEPAPEFTPPKPFISPIFRVGGGVGLFELTNPGASDTRLSGTAASAWVHAGDEFWDVFGYYLGARVGVLNPTGIESGGQTFDNYNSTEAFFADASAGVDLWVWPQVLGASVEAAYGAHGLILSPVRRTDYTLNSGFIGFMARARASLRLGEFGVHGEYTLVPETADETDGTLWSGWHAGLFVTYSPDLGSVF